MQAPEQSDASGSPLAAITACCQRERHTAQQGERRSPCCAELFRRAFGGEQDAWSAVWTIFERLMLAWAGVQHQVEPQDALQVAFMQFARYAPAQHELAATDELAPVLVYLRRCVKTAVIDQARRLKRHSFSEPLDDQANHVAVGAPDELVIVRATLRARIDERLKDTAERLAFELYFAGEWTAAAIAAAHPEQFADTAAVYVVVQRLRRRFTSDAELRELFRES